MTRLPEGAQFYVRHFQRDVLCGLYSSQVIRHDEGGLFAWTQQGSHHWFPYLPDGRQLRETPLPEWFGTDNSPTHRSARPEPSPTARPDWVWKSWVAPRSVLRWFPPTAPYAIEAWFEGQRLNNYYVNLGGPAVAWRDADGMLGVDTEDWDLDVWVEPDLSWRYKDEDDLRTRSQWPDLYWVDDPARVYEVGREAVELITNRLYPFDGAWRELSPDPARAAPAMADPAPRPGWDRPRHR